MRGIIITSEYHTRRTNKNKNKNTEKQINHREGLWANLNKKGKRIITSSQNSLYSLSITHINKFQYFLL